MGERNTCGGFEDTHRRCSDGDDAVAGAVSIIYCAGGFLGSLQTLFVPFVSSTVPRTSLGPPEFSRKAIRVPTRARLPGRSIAHQSFTEFSSSKKISNCPPVWTLTPRRRAGITRELFRTRTSPRRRYSS